MAWQASKLLRSVRKLPLAASVMVVGVGISLAYPSSAFAFNDCDPAIKHWGRSNCHGYFTNTVSNGGDVVIRSGVKAENVNQYLSIMSGYLNSTNKQEYTSAAFTISVMMGQDPAKYNGSIANGIAWAKANYNSWADRVKWYDTNKLIDWHYAFSSAVAYEDSGYGITNFDNFFITNPADSADDIRFRVPAGSTGTPFQIDRSCGNLQGYGSPLIAPPPPTTPPPATPPPTTPPPATPPPYGDLNKPK